MDIVANHPELIQALERCEELGCKLREAWKVYKAMDDDELIPPSRKAEMFRKVCEIDDAHTEQFFVYEGLAAKHRIVLDDEGATYQGKRYPRSNQQKKDK